MKATGFVCLFLALLLLLGCSGPAGSTGGMNMELVQMTAEELQIMTSLYSDVQRLQEGRLFPAEQEALAQLRAGVRYLEEKYPNENPQVLRFSPATKLSVIGQFELQSADSRDYTMTVTLSDGTYVLEDDYYGALVREDYDRYVIQLLADSGIECQSYTTFTSLKGMEINGSTTVSQLVSARLAKVTDLFVKNAVDSETVRILLRDKGLYGSYRLYTVPEEAYTDAAAMEANRKAWEPVSFNCFDAV